jgi:hypothetical protein
VSQAKVSARQVGGHLLVHITPGWEPADADRAVADTIKTRGGEWAEVGRGPAANVARCGHCGWESGPVPAGRSVADHCEGCTTKARVLERVSLDKGGPAAAALADVLAEARAMVAAPRLTREPAPHGGELRVFAPKKGA